jgi:hypothetical protein
VLGVELTVIEELPETVEVFVEDDETNPRSLTEGVAVLE